MTHALLALALFQGPFAVDTIRPAGGPEILWHRQASPLVALRLSAPIDLDLPAGAAELLQELARPAATAEARRFGADLRFHAAGDEAVISLTGPAAAFDALVAILRGAVAPPDLSVADLRPARARAEDRIHAALERPVPRLRTLLRASLAGRVTGGVDFDALQPERVRGIAERIHRPDRLRVVLVGAPPPEIVRSAFAHWPRHETFDAGLGVARLAPLPRPQAHHAWAALAYPLHTDYPAAAVAAALVQRRLHAAGLRDGQAEAWPATGGGSVLVVLGGAALDDPEVASAANITAFPTDGPDQGVSALARFLRRMIAEAAALTGPRSVAEAATALRSELLIDARTVTGRAEVLGRWSGPRGSRRPTVHDVLDGLAGLAAEDVRAVLDEALAGAPIRAEVRP